MDKNLPGRKVGFPLMYLLMAILAITVIRSLFGGSLLTPKTEMTYTEFRAALRGGKIQTATVSRRGSRGHWPTARPITPRGSRIRSC